MKKIYELSRYVKFQLFTVGEIYKLQLFEQDVEPNDIGVSCIWEDDHFDLDYLFDEAIKWCRDRSLLN